MYIDMTSQNWYFEGLESQQLDNNSSLMFARNVFLLVAENAWVLVRTLDIWTPIDGKSSVEVVGRVGFVVK